ncbi:hypothetical protein BC940DRAFT_314297 [Gongronella butleri]|nr:hypothetical protein BC940DRAFT_314297 [Gongronella butleri]
MGNYTVEDLVPRIQENMEAMEYTAAYAFCEKALSLSPSDPQLLEWMGQVEIELEKFAEARDHLLAAIQATPERSATPYMYLGQLSVGKDAIEAFQKGVDLMMRDHAQITDNDEKAQHGNKIATALCSMTEIYLTDCCFEPEAEQKCEEYLQQAQQVDPENAEVFQLLASVRLSQQRGDEAAQVLQHSIQLWIHKDASDATLPNYDSRLALVRLLMEVGDMQQTFTVLERLQKENDQVVDLWYLYGWAYFCLGEDAQNPEERNGHWEDARDCLQLALKLTQISGYDDDALIEHTNELLSNINSVVPPSAEEEEGEAAAADDDDDEFTSDDDEAMEM